MHLALFSRFVLNDQNCKNCQNIMRMSSWHHFEFKKLMSSTYNTPSFTSVELLVWQTHSFEKCTFKAIPLDTWWRHQANTPQIQCMLLLWRRLCIPFWNNYHKVWHKHLVKVLLRCCIFVEISKTMSRKIIFVTLFYSFLIREAFYHHNLQTE